MEAWREDDFRSFRASPRQKRYQYQNLVFDASRWEGMSALASVGLYNRDQVETADTYV